MRREYHAVRFSETDENGFIGIQIDAHGSRPGPSHELFHTYGFYSRPLDPELDEGGRPKPEAACHVALEYEGNAVERAWLGHDPRPIAKLPLIKAGESIHYGPLANFVRCHADGGVSVYTTDDGTENGRSIYYNVSPSGHVWIGPWGRATFDFAGFHVTHASGAELHLGGIGGMPAPLDELSSYFRVKAHMGQVEATALCLGTSAGVVEPVAKATSTLALFAAFKTATDALAAAVAAIGATPPVSSNPAVGTALTALTAALTGLATAVTAAQVALPSSSTTSS
jgi:hypothetical protein